MELHTLSLATIAPYAFFAAMLIACAIACVALLIIKQLHLRLKEREIALATAQSAIGNAEEHLADYGRMKSTHDTLIAERSRAVAERDEVEKQLNAMRLERDIAAKSKERAEFLKSESERKVLLTEQKLSDMNERMRDWETQKEHSLQAARAAILTAGGEMSSKLLEDHKRELESAKKQTEERVRLTTEQLMQQFDTISKTVHSLKDSTIHTREQMEMVMRSLTNPAGAGALAEIGLENSLKQLGLVKGRDFLIQYHVAQEEGKNLRPDAVVFLPQDTVMVIDCKASKAMLEIAKAETEAENARALAGLKKTMNDHLRALASKDYRAAVLQSFRDAGKSENVGHIFNVMYLPSESAIEHIRSVDTEFDSKLHKSGIILAGPASLAGLFSLAKLNIAAANQAENEKIILKLVADFMESSINALEHADKMGRNLKGAMDNFDSFSKSVNARLLPRMRALKDLGVTPTRHKDIPAPLASYDVRRVEQTVVIESNPSEEATAKVHPLPRANVTG
jgi:DNA recombination protein RmuC